MVFERPKAATTLSVTAGGNEFTVSYTPPASSAALSTVAVGTLANESPSSLRIARGLSDLALLAGCPTIRATDELKLSPSDKTIELRIFVDNVFSVRRRAIPCWLASAGPLDLLWLLASALVHCPIFSRLSGAGLMTND